MTRAAAILLAFVLCAGGLSSWRPAWAQDGASRPVAIGYVELTGDPRYRDDSAYAGIVFRTLGRPFPGAEVGIEDARSIGRFIGIDFSLEHASGASVEALAGTIGNWVRDKDIHFVLTDLPADALLELSRRVEGLPVLLFNISAADDRLRGSDCRRNVVHVYPSNAMLTDALVQYLATKGWDEILLLRGPSEADAGLVEAMRRSSEKFGVRIAEERDFVLSNDPRRRDESNVALVTGGIDYDVVFIADSDGEFDRYVPYGTLLPRPVVGTEGLVPRAWHWSWDRYGAPQVQHRFEALAAPRRMNGEAWAAFVAVKAVTQAALRTRSADFSQMRDFILSDAIDLDGAKGNPMSVRPWNHQLRQPILLSTGDAVIAEAPLREFLHRTNVLDTLGDDEPESACRMQDGPADGS